MPADSFTGLSCDSLYLDMSSNSMRGLHPDAFRGIEDKLTFLKLENNLLTTLPAALANLSNLVLLDIHDNPIKVFEESILMSLGSHLQMFHVGSRELSQWPQEFRQLESLKALRLYHLPMDHLPESAFSGFESNLTTLEINSTNLAGIPSAVCHLSEIAALIFVNNTNVLDETLLPVCKEAVSSMFSLALDKNNLNEFPDIFDIFPNTGRLSVSFNPSLVSVGKHIPYGNRVSALTMSNDALSEIPPSFQNFTNLKTLIIENNNISEIHDEDFDKLKKLIFIDLSDNPLRFISENAFENMTVLNHVILDNTNLPDMPETLAHLEQLRMVDFRNNFVNCSCDALGWLENMTDVTINGDCSETSSGANIETFMSLTLPFC